METTIQSHHSPGSLVDVKKPLVKGSNRKFYPKNQANDYVSRLCYSIMLIDYVSRFIDNFKSCLKYGSLIHLFKIYPNKDNPDKHIFNAFGLICFPLRRQGNFPILKLLLKPPLKPQSLFLNLILFFTSNPQ